MGNHPSALREHPQSDTNEQLDRSVIAQPPERREGNNRPRFSLSHSFPSLSTSNTSTSYFRRQRSRQNEGLQADVSDTTTTRGGAGGREERRLERVSRSELEGSPTYMTPPRRSRTTSRFGSRIVPDSFRQSLLSNNGETDEEGQHLREASTHLIRPAPYRSAGSATSLRFSLTSPFRRRNELQGVSPRRSARGTIELGSEHDLSRTRASAPATNETLHENAQSSANADSASTIRRARTRITRARSSIVGPLGNIFSQSQGRLHTGQQIRSPPMRPSSTPFVDDSDHLLPSLSNPEPRGSDLEDPAHELDATESEARNALSPSRITSGMSTIRRFPHGLRSRSTRLIRRGEHPPLSQVLHLAAAAIAAQLSGHALGNAGTPRAMGTDAFDGSIQNFVQTLQDAASAQAGENVDLHAADGDLPPVNFMRVFQFPNDENGTPITSTTQNGRASDQDNGSRGSTDGDRSVTLVLVGVRSMPNISDGNSNDGVTAGPSLDTLLSLPFLPPTNVLRNGSSGALFRRSDTRTRAHHRRHSMNNFHNFPQQYESQRHQRTRPPTIRRASDQISDSLDNNAPTAFSDSPSGPHPPPSTPADIRSGHATPSQRPSSASAVHVPGSANSNESNLSSSAEAHAESSFNVARQRRRSDSEFARRPELSSGNARRNGVVEPDRMPTGPGRSWLIYVVGTNVSPDHPAFAMPSLFTDNPSYEDMQMLSTLLGPVKPPVASQEDIRSAGGVFKIVVRDGILTAEATNGQEQEVAMSEGERCLICLGNYAPAEEVRRLNGCQHVYHRECIDEWLTTGRNSCPMCRGPGVKETGNAASPAAAGATSTP